MALNNHFIHKIDGQTYKCLRIRFSNELSRANGITGKMRIRFENRNVWARNGAFNFRNMSFKWNQVKKLQHQMNANDIIIWIYRIFGAYKRRLSSVSFLLPSCWTIYSFNNTVNRSFGKCVVGYVFCCMENASQTNPLGEFSWPDSWNIVMCF